MKNLFIILALFTLVISCDKSREEKFKELLLKQQKENDSLNKIETERQKNAVEKLMNHKPPHRR